MTSPHDRPKAAETCWPTCRLHCTNDTIGTYCSTDNVFMASSNQMRVSVEECRGVLPYSCLFIRNLMLLSSLQSRTRTLRILFESRSKRPHFYRPRHRSRRRKLRAACQRGHPAPGIRPQLVLRRRARGACTLLLSCLNFPPALSLLRISHQHIAVCILLQNWSKSRGRPGEHESEMAANK